MISGADGARMRFLFTTAETHPTHRADVRVLFGKYLPQFGIDTDLVATARSEGAEVADPQRWGGGEVHVRRARSRAGLIVADLVQQFTLFRLCRTGRYDGLIVRDKPFLGIVGWVAARLAGIPFIYWMSFPMTESDRVIAATNDGSVGWLRRVHTGTRGLMGAIVLYRILLPQADHVFVQSPAMLEHVRALGLRHARVSDVPMGVDLEALPVSASTRAAPLGDRQGVYLGTLNLLRRRELEIMVDSALEVAKRFPDYVLVVIGESEAASERGWLQRYAESRSASKHVKFTGWVPYAEGLRLASGASVGISPVPRGPLFDMGCPTKAIEYMALGLPVVCNDQPDQAAVVSQSGGGLCVELSAPAFASAVVELLSTPARARELGAAGREWVAAHRDYRGLAATVAQTLRLRCGARRVEGTLSRAARDGSRRGAK